VAVPLSDKPKPDVPGMELDGLAGWNSIGEHSVSPRSWIKAGAWLVALMVVCSVVYWWWQRPRHPVQAHHTPPPKTTPAPQAALPAPPAANAPVAAAPSTENPPVAPPKAAQASADPTATPPAVNPQIPITAPNPNATVHVGVTADEPVWIRVDVNGKALFSGTLQAHETRNVDADGTVALRVGNAGGVTLTFNGKPVGAVGPKGQIRIVQFTSGGFQIVSPPKSFDPLDRL
jgi:cytoskeleton protein RodZ